MADETEKLINLVHTYAFLYDTGHADYKNVVKKADTWNEIAGILNQSSDSVKKKWKNLRDSYIKYLKYLNGATGSSKKYQNWPWAAYLEFLRDSISPRSTSSTVSQSNEYDDEHEEDTRTSGTSQPQTTARVKKRKEVTEDMAAILNYIETKKEKSQLDHVDHLFLSYAHTFKKLSLKTQAVLKMELAQLFGRAELHEIDAQTPLSSSMSSPSTSRPHSNPLDTDDISTLVCTDLQLPSHATNVMGFRAYSSTFPSAKDFSENSGTNNNKQ